jgi:hypothetical protein
MGKVLGKGLIEELMKAVQKERTNFCFVEYENHRFQIDYSPKYYHC